MEMKGFGKTLVVKLNGEIDHHIAADIKRAIEDEYYAGRYKNIILDFEGVGFMDSSGVGMVIGRYKTTALYGGKFAVVNVHRQMERIFELSGLARLVSAYASVEEALKDMGEGVDNGVA